MGTAGEVKVAISYGTSAKNQALDLKDNGAEARGARSAPWAFCFIEVNNHEIHRTNLTGPFLAPRAAAYQSSALYAPELTKQAHLIL